MLTGRARPADPVPAWRCERPGPLLLRRLRAVPDPAVLRRGLLRLASLLLAASVLGLWLAAPALAEVTGTPDDGALRSGEPAEAVGGTLEADGSPVAGALVQVRRDGAQVGEAVSGPDGRWVVAVPGTGTYEVVLVTGSLPDGVELRDPDDNVRDRVRVSPGREQTVRFAFDDVAAGTSSRGDRLVNTLWNGLKFGLVVALCSIGLSLVFGTTGLVNFAHAELVTIGALVAWFFNSPSAGPGVSLFIAGALAVVASGAFGAAVRLGVWRPLERRRTGLISMMIVSIGLGLALRHLYGVVFGTSPRTFGQFAAQSPWQWGPLMFPPKDLVVIPLGIAVLAAFALALQRTRLGTAIRAVSDNRDLAESSGIDVQRVILAVWVVGSALAGFGGIIFAVTQSVSWDMGWSLLLTIFAGVILGGLGSVYGPIVGGLAVGMAAELSTLWFSAEFKTAFALGALILVLLARPQGIFGVRQRVG